MSTTVRALRGATTIDVDSVDEVRSVTIELLREMVDRNDIAHDDIVSILFTATDDIHSMFPAAAAREIGFGDVPLMCARELDIVGATPLCIRVLLHLNTGRSNAELRHVYLRGASGLRDDLPG